MRMKYIRSPRIDPYFNLALEQYVFDSLDRSWGYFMLWQNDHTIVVGKHQNTVEEIDVSGEYPQHPGVMRAFAARILRGEALVAPGEEGIRGLTLSNAMHLSSWLGRPVELPVDEELFYRELQKKCEHSREKAESDIMFDTAGSY